VERSFCEKCGSSLFIRNPKHPDVVIIASGNLDGVDEWRPKLEFYCKRKAAWVGVGTETVRFAAME
jgi:hypothetical protein